MPGLDDWTQIPSGLLDLADKANDAANWAAGQRAQLAETWGNAQRSVLQQMSQTWQQGVNGVQDFAQGFSGTAAPSYNDMAGASSSGAPLDQTPSNYFGITPSISPNPRLLNQAIEEGNQQREILQNKPYSPEAIDVAGGPIINSVAEDVPLVPEARAALGQVGRGILGDVGNVAQGILGQDATRMYHGTGSAFERPEPGKFDPNGLFGPGYYLTDSPEVAGSYAAARQEKTLNDFGTQELQRYLASAQKNLAEARDGLVKGRNEQGLVDYWAQQVGDLTDQLNGKLQQMRAGPNVRAVDVPAGSTEPIPLSKPKKVPDFSETAQAKQLGPAIDAGNKAVEQARVQFGYGSPEWQAANTQAEAARRTWTDARQAYIAKNGTQQAAQMLPSSKIHLLDVDGPISQNVANRIDTAVSQAVGGEAGQSARHWVQNGYTGQDVYESLYGLARQETGNLGSLGADTESKALVNEWLQAAGFDGIQYNGGKRIPLTDANGRPIEHQAVAIFPNALGKLRNALSGTYGGLLSEGRPIVQAAETARPGSFAANTLYDAERNLASSRKAYDVALQSGDEIAIQQTADAYTKAQTDVELARQTYYPSKSYRQPRGFGPSFGRVGNQIAIGAGQGAIGGGIAASQQEGATPGSIALGALEGAPGGAVQGALRAGLPTRFAAPILRAVGEAGKAAGQGGDNPDIVRMFGSELGSKLGPLFDQLKQAEALGNEKMANHIRQLIGVNVNLLSTPDISAADILKQAKKTYGGSILPPATRPSSSIVPPSSPGFAGNIRLEKLPQDVQQVVQDTYNAAPQVFEAARRGVISDAEVQQLADQAGTTVQKVVDRWKPGQAQNAETLLALRQTLAAKAKDVLDAQQAVQQSNSAENLLKLQLALKEHGAVQEAVSGVTAEAGRALRQFRQSVTGAIASGNQQKMEDLLKKLGGREWTADLAQRLGQLDVNDPTQVGTFIRDIYKPKAADYLNEWYYNAILSAPPTHIANAVSNSLNALTAIPERYLSGAFEEGVSRLEGRPKQRFVGEGTAAAYGLLRGLPEGVQAFTYAMTHGFTPEQALAGIKGEGTFRGQAFKGPIGNAINVPSRLLSAADAFFYPVLQRAEQNALIFRQAKSEGLSGKALADRITELTANVPAHILEQAAKTADYQLYRQAPKTIGQAAIKARGMQFLGVEPLRFVIPFLQVPINATKYGLERSPLGFINAARNLATKDPSAADSLARAAIGSAVWGAVYAQVLNGNLDITGAPPTAPGQRDAFYRQGKLPFAIKIGDTWHSYQRWEPFNHALTQVAAVVDATRNAKQGMSLPDIAGQAGLTEAQNVESQTFLTGISGLLNAASDPARYGAQFVAQLETGPLPLSGAMRTAANVLDTRQRAPQGPVENIKSVIPGLSQQVPSRLNEFGETSQQPASPLLPYKSQQANMTPLETELQNNGVEPGPTGKTLRGIDLTREEQRAYQQTSGQTVKQLLEQVIRDPRYQAASPGDKQRILQRAILTAKDYAAKQYVGQLATQQGTAALLQRIQQKKNASLPMAAAR